MTLLQTTPPFLGRGQSGGDGGGGWTTETLVFSDTFTEASNTRIEDHTPDLGTGWVNRRAAGDYQILASTDQLWSRNVPMASDVIDSIAADQAVEAEMLNNTDFNGVIARATFAGSGWGNFDGYGALHNGGDVYLYSFEAGVGTTLLASVPLAFSSGQLIRLECFGTSLKVLVNGVEQISVTNSDWSSGKAGVRSQVGTNGVVFDNFKVYELS